MQQTLHASYTIPFSFNPSSLLKIDQPERNNYILYVESMYTRQATSSAKPGNEYKMIKDKREKKIPHKSEGTKAPTYTLY